MLSINIAIHTCRASVYCHVGFRGFHSHLHGSPFRGLSDIESPRVDGPPVMPEDPYAYVPEFMPQEDDVLPAEEHPWYFAVLPTADSPGYIADSDPEKDKVDPEKDPEVDPTDYPIDGGDDDDESSDDDEDDDDDVEEDEEEYRVLPPPPASPTYLLGYRAAMIRLRAEAPSTSHSPPLPPPIILSHTRSDTPPSGTPPFLPIPLPTSSPSLLLPSTDHGADRPEVCLPPQKRLCFDFSLRYEVGESSSAPATRPTGGFRTDYGFIATLDREIRRDLEREVGYKITDTWDEMLEDMSGAPVTDETELGQRMTNFVTTVRQDIDEIYVRLGEAQNESTTVRDYSLVSSRPRLAGTACGDTEADEYTADTGDNTEGIVRTL
ncbi:hypothetical protein Tco_1457204 [Tanacetum coccineum]